MPRVSSIACLLPLFFALGCPSFKLSEPPSGFAEVSSNTGDNAYLRAKARDNVGLHVVSFGNVKGGDLPYWCGDLVEKLGRRSYSLDKQTPVESANGVAGTRFDFRYTPHGEEHEKFFTAVLFVSDEYRVVVQMAGDTELGSQHESELGELIDQIKIGGCKPGSDTCKGPQPEALSIE
jgi:hypothetical protein